MRTAENILKHEFIGLEATVSRSLNRAQEGISGRIIDETRNMLTIETPEGDKRLVKKDCFFVLLLEEGKVEVNGSLLEGRPEDRVKKKLKKW